MTATICKPGEVPTLFNTTASPTNSINPGLNSTLANNTTAVVQPPVKKNDSISFKTTLQPAPYGGSYYLDIPQKSNFNFGPGSPLCPTNDCKQEFIMSSYNTYDPQSPLVTGTLKIENKTTSTTQTIKYNLV